MNRIIFISVFIILIVTGCNQSTESSQPRIKLNVSAAASMTESLLALQEIFEAEYPEIEITYNFGGTGTLRKQIEQGAPADLFFSASKKDYEMLETSGKVKAGSIIFKNKLVIITPDSVEFDSLEAFVKSDEKMAIGTPNAVPVGSYSKQVLEKMNVWDELQGRLVLTKDVQQVITYVNDGVVSAGIVYVSDLNKANNTHIMGTIDPSYHEPIEYFVASIQTKDSGNEQKMKAVETFYSFVQSETSMKLFESYDFETNRAVKE